MLSNKCLRHAQSEHNRLSSKAEKDRKFVELNGDMDPNRNRSDTSMKCREKDHLAISNYLQILKFEEEVPGRKHTRKYFIDALQRVEIRFDDEDEDARARRRMKEARSEDKEIVDSIADELFESAERINENMNESGIDLSVELDVATIGSGDENHDEEDDNDNDDSVVVSSAKVIVATTQCELNVILTAVNKDPLGNGFAIEEKIMEKQSPKVRRHKKSRRKKRIFVHCKSFHESAHANAGSPEIEESFSRLLV